MSKKQFNPKEWLDNTQTNNFVPSVEKQKDDFQFSTVKFQLNDIEDVVSRIESSAIDIAPNYADWRDLGFALADALGENGRDYYQRLSRFYPNYSASETDKQFSSCLKAHGTASPLKHFPPCQASRNQHCKQFVCKSQLTISQNPYIPSGGNGGYEDMQHFRKKSKTRFQVCFHKL